MKRKCVFLVSLFSAFVFSSCLYLNLDGTFVTGEGPVVERTLQLSEVRKINLTASFDVVLIQGSEQQIEAVGNSNIIDCLITSVNNGEWNVGFKPGSYSDFDLTVYITVPSIDAVKINGSGDLYVEDFNQTNDLDVSINGSGDVRLKKLENCKKLTAKINGSGDIDVLSDIHDLEQTDIKIYGSGSFNGYRLHTDTCSVWVNGSGNVYVYANDRLLANIYGSGNIYYKGYPDIHSTDNGSGNLRNEN